MALLFPAGYQFFDSNGDPLASGTVRFYSTGTTTDKAVYSDDAMSVAVSNPYSLNSAGRIAVNLYGSGDYTVLVKDSSAVTVFSRDKVFGWDDLVYSPTGTGAVERNISTKLSERISGVDYGMVGDGSTNNTTAFNNAVAAAIAANDSLYIPPGNYRFTSRPAAITGAVRIYGDSMSSTVLERNYNEATSTNGFITIQANGVSMQGLSVNAISGTTGGAMVSIVSTASLAVSFVSLQDMSLSTYGTDTHAYTLYIDGSAKTSAPIGTRDMSFKNLHVFGAATKAAYLKGVVGLNWMGGGIYQAGGTDGGMTITGDGTVGSFYLDTSLSVITGALGLDYLTYANIRASVFNGAINNTSNVSYVRAEGTIVGAVQNNWASSGVSRPQTLFNSTTYDPVSLADGAGTETDLTVTGAALGDFARASFSLDTQGINLDAQVTATNTVTVRFQNETGGTIDLGSGTIRVEVIKPQA